MKLQSYLSAAALRGLASAGPRSVEPKGHEWRPAGESDSRSPCPGLNVLANHGWLPRSGKNIDIDVVRYAAAGAFDFEPTAYDSAVQTAIDFKLTTTGNASTFNLADLAKHDEIEFDGSLSRNDFYFGDNLHFNPAIWHTVAENLDLYDMGHGEKGKFVVLETAAKACAARMADAKRVNPTFNASSNEIKGSPGTTALYMLTMWDDAAGAAPKAWIKQFFEYERIPYLEGFKRPSVLKTGERLQNMTSIVVDVINGLGKP